VKNAVSRRADDARNLLQRLTFIYLATYLLVGGFGLLVMPELTLRLLLSSGSYGDVMPRLVGLFMIALGGSLPGLATIAITDMPSLHASSSCGTDGSLL
jgi:hypothetical protein